MRTTLSLDDDVAVRLEREQRKRKTSFKATVNAVLRAGLEAVDDHKAPRRPFRTKGFNLGSSRVGSLDNVAEVLARADIRGKAGGDG